MQKVLDEMTSLKAETKERRFEVENLRKAKFQTPIQVLFPDQYDGGSMIISVKACHMVPSIRRTAPPLMPMFVSVAHMPAEAVDGPPRSGWTAS